VNNGADKSGRSSVGEEIRTRLPRLLITTLILIILYFALNTLPPLFTDFPLLDLGFTAETIVRWAITLMIIIALARFIPDIIILADIGTNIFVKLLGVKEELSFKRAGRDIIYIILTILLGEAAIPFIASIQGIGNLLATVFRIILLIIGLILFYDFVRSVYKVIMDKTKVLADWVARMAEKAVERKD